MTRKDQLGNFELMVMLALIRLGDNAYGVPISEELEKRTGRDVAIGSVYAALERLEDKGFVASELGEATPERGGRAKRYFHVTGRGLKIPFRRSEEHTSELQSHSDLVCRLL